MRKQCNPDVLANLAPEWASELSAHFDKNGALTRPMAVKTMLRLMHAIRSHAGQCRTTGSTAKFIDPQARVIAKATGYRLGTARWIYQALTRAEHAQFASVMAPLRTAFDRHGRVRHRIRTDDAAAAVGILRYYAGEIGISPARVFHQLLQSDSTCADFDLAAAHTAFVNLTRVGSNSGQPGVTYNAYQAAYYDWAQALEEAFDQSGRRAKPLSRRASMVLLAAIGREANSGAAKCAFEINSSTSLTNTANEYRILRRACLLLHARTHLNSPVSAILVIAALKAASKSTLLFQPLTRLASGAAAA
jgi:hypothetical protein